MGDACPAMPAIFASTRSMHLVYSTPAILLTIVVFVAMTFWREPVSANRHKHGFLALFFAVVMPVCYVLIVLDFPKCKKVAVVGNDIYSSGDVADQFGKEVPGCTACLGWWYTPLQGTFKAPPIMYVFNGFGIGGATGSAYIAFICLCSKPLLRLKLQRASRLNRPEPLDLWMFVPVCIISCSLVGIYGFMIGMVVVAVRLCRRARDAVPDLSTDASIQITPQQVSEVATSSLMSNQATPDVCIEAGAPVQVPVLQNGPAEAVSPLEA